MIRKLYEWVLSWAETKYGTSALGFVAFTESSFFPVPPDPLLIALCLGKPRRSFWFAAVCSVMSVLGGILGYIIGWEIWELVDQYFFTYVFSQESFLIVKAKYNDNAFLAILGAAFTPIPYKVFTVAAGVSQISLLTLILASAIGRSARFFTVGTLIFLFGPSIKTFIDKYFNLLVILFFILFVLGFIVVEHWLR